MNYYLILLVMAVFAYSIYSGHRNWNNLRKSDRFTAVSLGVYGCRLFGAAFFLVILWVTIEAFVKSNESLWCIMQFTASFCAVICTVLGLSLVTVAFENLSESCGKTNPNKCTAPNPSVPVR
jgi:xanthine/uracil permease